MGSAAAPVITALALPILVVPPPCCASRATLLGLVFKLAMSVEKHWRRLRGLQYLADVVRGVKFVYGVKQEKQNQTRVQLQQGAA